LKEDSFCHKYQNRRGIDVIPREGVERERDRYEKEKKRY
jgi:hypothetical protein